MGDVTDTTSSTAEKELISTERVELDISDSRNGAIRHGVVLYLQYSRIAIKRLFVARPARHRVDKEEKGRVSVRVSRRTTTAATHDELPSKRCSLTAFFPVIAARRVPALSARMEIRSVSRFSSFSPSIRGARASPD